MRPAESGRSEAPHVVAVRRWWPRIATSEAPHVVAVRRWWPRIALLPFGALVCCNSIVGFDELVRVDAGDAGAPTGTNDAGVDSAPPPEAAPAARCDPNQDFAAPAIIAELDGTQSTQRMIMTPDELEIFYLLGDEAPYSLRHAIRASRDATWNAPVTESLDPDASSLGSLAVDGLKLYYWHVDSGSDTLASVPAVATRQQLQDPFTNGTELLSQTDRPIVVPNTDDAAYWATFVLDGGSSENVIFRGIVSGVHVTDGVEVSALHITGAEDDNPTLVGNQELTIYFSSTRDPAIGASDVWRASRTSLAQDFGTPTPVTGASSSDPDQPSWVSADECVILLDRLRHSYLARRPAPAH